MPDLNAPILVMKAPWFDMLLNGTKSLEIRGTRCAKSIGTRVYFSKSGTGTISGFARFAGCEGPLSLQRYDELIPEHCVKDIDSLPYARTFSWRFEGAEWLTQEIPYVVKRGSIGWRKFQAVTS